MKLLSLIALFCLNAQAQYFDPGLLQLLDLNNARKSSSKGIQCLFSENIVSNKATDDRHMRECAFALCGNPADNESVFLTNTNFEKSLTREARSAISKLNPKIDQVLKKTKKDKLAQAAAMEKLLLDKGSLKISPGEWSGEFKSELNEVIFSPHIDLIVNFKKPRSERLKVKINYPKNSSPEFRLELESYARAFEVYAKNNSNKSQELGLYSEAEYQQLVDERFTAVKKKYDQNKNKLSAEKIKDLEIAFKNFDQNKELNNPLLSLASLEALEESSYDFMPELKKINSAPQCSDEIRCMLIYNQFLKDKNIAGNIKQYKKDLEDPVLFEQAKNSCRAQVAARSSKVTDLKTANELFGKVKNQLYEKVLPRFSEHSRKIIKDYLDKNIKVVDASKASMPDPVKEFGAASDAYLDDKFIPFEPTEEESLKTILFNSLYPDLNQPLSIDGSPCGPKMEFTAWDAYGSFQRAKSAGVDPKELKDMNGKDYFYISNFSCHHQQKGKSVVAHELGHAVNEIFARIKLSTASTKIYKTQRMCATKNYLKAAPEPAEFSQPDDGFRTEEDMADLIAFMTYSDDKNLFACSMLKPSPNSKTYADLSVLPVEDDPHSAFLFRVINEAINKNVELPYSCQSALEPLKNDIRIKKCSP